MRKIENTEKYFNRAMKIMPGGVSSPVRSMKAIGGLPLYIKEGKGASIIDIDDNSYYDLCMSFGPLILGHTHNKVIKAISDTLHLGTSFGTCSSLEVELAEKIIAAHPTTDWVRFVNSGTEAVMSAIRLARGYTSRDLIIKFSGNYHGHVDSMLVKAGSGLVTFGISSSAGVTENTSKDTIVLELGNLEQLHDAFNKLGENIAAVIIEGIPANNGLLIQTKKFMHEIQRLTQKNGSLFILDEVITGFRLGLGGAASYYGLKPDIVTLGKIIGGGLPVGAYGGRIDLMDQISPLGNVYQAGTLSGNPLAMAAGNAALSLLSDQTYGYLEEFGARFERKMLSSFEEKSIPLSIKRVGSIIWIILEKDSNVTTPSDISEEVIGKYSKFHKNALDEGVYLPPSAFEVSFLSLAHGNVIDDIVERLTRAGERI